MIPRTFHRIWVGSEMPEEFRVYGARWAELHPDWTLVDWDEHSLPELENQDLFNHAGDIAPDNVGQLRSDIARLELLYRFGGVYLDCDFEPCKPIDRLLDRVTLFAAWESDGIWINNAIVGAEPQHPFIAHLIEGLPASVAANQGKRPNVMSGPQYLTRMKRALEPQMTIFPQKLFYPYSYHELHRRGEAFPDAYAIHHWANKRRRATA